MSGRVLAALRIIDPAKWLAMVREAMEAGSPEAAAVALGVSARTVYRWVASTPELAEWRKAPPAWHHTTTRKGKKKATK